MGCDRARWASPRRKRTPGLPAPTLIMIDPARGLRWRVGRLITRDAEMSGDPDPGRIAPRAGTPPACEIRRLVQALRGDQPGIEAQRRALKPVLTSNEMHVRQRILARARATAHPGGFIASARLD